VRFFLSFTVVPRMKTDFICPPCSPLPPLLPPAPSFQPAVALTGGSSSATPGFVLTPFFLLSPSSTNLSVLYSQTHYAFVVPWMFLLQGYTRVRYSAAWTLVNAQFVLFLFPHPFLSLANLPSSSTARSPSCPVWPPPTISALSTLGSSRRTRSRFSVSVSVRISLSRFSLDRLLTAPYSQTISSSTASGTRRVRTGTRRWKLRKREEKRRNSRKRRRRRAANAVEDVDTTEEKQ
jgi:hypothetical protein